MELPIQITFRNMEPSEAVAARIRELAARLDRFHTHIMSCRVVGVLLMEDEAGGDEKIIAVPSNKLTRRYESIKNYSDLPSITLEQIEHFFSHYKDLEHGKWVKVTGWGDADRACQLVADAIDRAKKKKLSLSE